MEPPRGTTPVPNTGGVTRVARCTLNFPFAVFADGLTTEDGKQAYAFLIVLLITGFIWTIDARLGKAIVLLILFYIVLRNGDMIAMTIERVFRPFVPQEG